MRKIVAGIIIAVIAGSFMVSCKGTNHSVYMEVSGTAAKIQIKYGKGSSISQAEGSNLVTLSNLTQAQLPWVSEVYTVDSGSSAVFYLEADNEGTSIPNLTVAIYDNGTLMTYSTINSINQYNESVSYGAN